jgi:hypothetical protein
MKTEPNTEVLFIMMSAPEEVLALFPRIAWNRDPDTCVSYAHCGQHGAASVQLAQECRLATPEEYSGLFNELEGMGYHLTVITEVPDDAYEERKLQI